MNLNSAQADEDADVSLQHLAHSHVDDADDAEGSDVLQERALSSAVTTSDTFSRPPQASAWASYVSTDHFDAGGVDDELDQVSVLVCSRTSFLNGILTSVRHESHNR